jgi:hypothetical protein
MLHETKCSFETFDKIASKCWRGWKSKTTDAEGASKGFKILWLPSYIILNHFFSTRHSLTSNF